MICEMSLFCLLWDVTFHQLALLLRAPDDEEDEGEWDEETEGEGDQGEHGAEDVALVWAGAGPEDGFALVGGCEFG